MEFDMEPVVALIAPGGMGAALATRLTENRLKVLTTLTGRSDAAIERASAAGMVDASHEALMEADILLSVVPPDQALPLAQSLAPALSRAAKAPHYVDCNAISTETAHQVAAVITATGATFSDGGIIGLPPKSGTPGPKLYVSGKEASEIGILKQFGIDVRIMSGPVGAASALKLSYAGITKGLIAVGSAMLLAAEKAGVGPELAAELAASQPNHLASFSRSIPDMFSKAGRWVPEMREIADFAEPVGPVPDMYRATADFYNYLASESGEGSPNDTLASIVARLSKLKP